MKYLHVNFILFQLGWFACVLGPVYQLPYAGVVYGLVFLGAHLLLQKQRSQEALFIFGALIVGYSGDSLMAAGGLISYLPDASSSLAPLWIASLWAMFASTIGHSLAWMAPYRTASALAGAVFGPVAYLSAQKLGAVTLVQALPALLATSILWAVAMPLLFSARQWLVSESNNTQEGMA